MYLLILQLLPNFLKLCFLERPYIWLTCGLDDDKNREVMRQSHDISYQFLDSIFSQLLFFSNDGIDLTSGGGFGDIIDRFSFGEIKLWYLAGWLFWDGFGEEGALGQVDVSIGHLLVLVLFVISINTSQLLRCHSWWGYGIVKVHLRYTHTHGVTHRDSVMWEERIRLSYVEGKCTMRLWEWLFVLFWVIPKQFTYWSWATWRRESSWVKNYIKFFFGKEVPESTDITGCVLELLIVFEQVDHWWVV